MPNIQVLIVDDSTVIRRILREAFSADPIFEIAGAATNGRAALMMIEQSCPDIVILDIEMPEMDGLQALTAIRERYPKLPVIMFSTLTAHGAVATVEALTRGATDYVTKSSDLGKYSDAVERVRRQLVPKAKAICDATLFRRSAAKDAQWGVPSLNAPPLASTVIDAVAIGTSTGGPNALASVMGAIPQDFPVPILIVQHMPPLFTKYLAERLRASGNIPVAEAKHGEELFAGGAWIAPGDYHMTVVRNGTHVRIQTNQNPAENSCRPSVDVLFRSVAKAYGRSTLAVVMTGMGQDGLRGCEHIKVAGGQVLAQDEHSSVVWGMPGFVAKAGLADRVLPLDQIGAEIVRRVRMYSGSRTKYDFPEVGNGHRRAGI